MEISNQVQHVKMLADAYGIGDINTKTKHQVLHGIEVTQVSG
jgi:hypothetical protein